MALIRFVVLYLALTLALILVLKNVSDCRNRYGGCFIPHPAVEEAEDDQKESAPILYTRKLLNDFSDENSKKKKNEIFTSFEPLDDQRSGPNTDAENLRTVPSGPDPLHHHGGGAKKPQTP